MKMRSVFVCAAVLALAVPAMAEKSPIKPGKWQMTMRTEIPNFPVKMPPITMTQCVTQEMADNPESTLPKGSDKKNSSCKVGDYKLSGSTVSWTVDCPKEGIKGKGEITYSEDSYEGSMDMTMGETAMKAKYSGKLLGACDAK